MKLRKIKNMNYLSLEFLGFCPRIYFGSENDVEVFIKLNYSTKLVFFQFNHGISNRIEINMAYVKERAGTIALLTTTDSTDKI